MAPCLMPEPIPSSIWSRSSQLLVRLTTDRAGLGSFQFEGQVYDVSKEEARRLIAARQAEPVEAAPEVATQEPTKPRRRGRSKIK